MPSPGAQRGDVNIGRGGFIGDEPDWEGAAAAADMDVGMAGGGPSYANDPNAFNVRAGPDIPMGYNPDVIAAIAAQLDAAAESGGGAPYNPAVVNEDDLVGRMRVIRQAEEQRNARMQAQIAAMEAQRNWTGGFNPNLDNYWGVANPVGSMMPIVNEDAAGALPTSYYENEWGMQDARSMPNFGADMASGAYPNVVGADATSGALPSGTSGFGTQFADMNPIPPPGAGVIRTGVGQDITDPNYDRSSQMVEIDAMMAQQDRARQMGQIDATMGQQDRARQMGDIDAIMAQQAAQRYGSDLSAPLIPGGGPTPSQAEATIGPPGIGGNNFYGMVTDPTPPGTDFFGGDVGSPADYAEAEERAWSFMADDAVGYYLNQAVTARDLVNANTLSKLDKLTTNKAKEESKKLSSTDKAANLAARRKAERDYVDYRDILNENVKDAKTVLAKTIKDHGKKSDEAKKAKKDLRVAQENLILWENSDLYIKSYSTVKRPGWGHNWPVVGTPLKVITSIEDYFHSLGKTERREPKEVLQDMKDNPEKYKTKGEVSNANLVKNMYPFLKSAPTDVAAAAATEPAYLRYLMNLNVNKQPIPKFYSPYWKKEVSDAWIYG